MMIKEAVWKKFCPCSSTTVITTAPDIISSSDSVVRPHIDGKLEVSENSVFDLKGQNENVLTTSRMAAKLKIILFYGSTREGRLVERVGAYVKSVVESQGMDPIIFDPEEMPFEPFKTPFHFYRDPADIPVWMDKANDRIKSADGFIIITPEYNGELPSALTNMINTFPPWSFRHRPVALVTYSMGQWGGARVMVNARHYSTELGMLPIPTHAIIPVAQNAFETYGTCKVERTANKIASMVTELKWYVNALNNQKSIEALPDFKPEWA